MQKILKFFLFGVLICSVFLGCGGRFAFADDQWSKLGRGCANVAMSPFEVIYQPYYMLRDERFGVALFGGIFKGIAYMGKRIGVGLYEIATFPFPGKNNYDPIIEPEFVIPIG